jgi:hypothetical protein
MNNKNTEDTVRDYFSLANTSQEFAPSSASWLKCHSFTYLPHPNECGPRSLLAASVIATHPTPNDSILLPYMNPNVAQISRWWVVKSILNQKFELNDLSCLFHHVSHFTNHSWNQPAIPFNLAPLRKQHTDSPPKSFSRTTISTSHQKQSPMEHRTPVNSNFQESS